MILLQFGWFRATATANFFKGRYKGIPWRIAVDDSRIEKAVVRIYFWSAGFPSFFLMRLILIPFIATYLINKGGFYTIGTVFETEHQRFLLFGDIGIGKTTTFLNFADQALYIGDGNLAIDANGVVDPIVPEIELRYATVRRFPRLWSSLSCLQKLELFGCWLLSSITARRISFNIGFAPEELRIDSKHDSGAKPISIIHLVKGVPTPQTVPPEELSDRIVKYFLDYLGRHDYVFGSKPSIDKLRANISQFLQTCESCWVAPPLDHGKTWVLDLLQKKGHYHASAKWQGLW